jgi:hypothetical protein
MKALFFFILGAFAGAYAVHVYDERGGGSSAERPPAGGSVGDSISWRLREWHLGPDDINADLARTGQVFRENAAAAGGRISDVRMAAVIKAKFVIDRDLSARDIAVRVDDGRVTLTGTVPSADLIGRATALALDTGGVRNVTARLAVRPGN